MHQEQLSALLVSDGNQWHRDLEEFLKNYQISFENVQGCEPVLNALNQSRPQVIITATKLHDGTWRDVVSLVEKAPVPASIIVVAEDRVGRPYLSAAIDHGVFDFIHPPFESEMQACVIQVAARDARRRRRKAQALETSKYLV